MIRDFSQDARDLLHSQVDAVSPQGQWEYIKDFLGDLGLEIQAWIGVLSINSYIDNIDAYHNKIIDKNNISKEQIDKIFQDVADVDTSFAEKFKEIQDCIVDKAAYINKLAGVISITDPIGFATSTYFLKESVGDVREKELKAIWECYTEGELAELSAGQKKLAEKYISQHVQELGRDVVLLNEEEKKQDQMFVVDLYRMLEPETAERFDALFDSANDEIGDFDRYNIMYIAYTAEEPYRSLFFDTLGTYTIGSVKLSGTSFYTVTGSTKDYPDAVANTVNFDIESAFYHCPKGAYNTFFHECGHAIDYQLGEGGFYTVSYDNGSNYEIIAKDVYDNIEQQIEAYGKEQEIIITNETKEKIIESIKEGDTSLLNQSQEKIYKVVIRRMEIALSKTSTLHKYETEGGLLLRTKAAAGISDVYGGITNNIVMGDRGHFPKNNGEPFEYWYYAETGEKTGAQEKEMWAHYFSFEICGDTEAIDMMEEYLPETMQQYDRMVQDMQEGIEESDE